MGIQVLLQIDEIDFCVMVTRSLRIDRNATVMWLPHHSVHLQRLQNIEPLMPSQHQTCHSDFKGGWDMMEESFKLQRYWAAFEEEVRVARFKLT
jgi:hypothetical protein